MAPFDTRYLPQQPLRFSDTSPRGKKRKRKFTRGIPLTLRHLSQKSAWWLYDTAAEVGITIAEERLVYLKRTTDNKYCKERSVGSVETLHRQRTLYRNRAGLGSERWLCSSERPCVCMRRGVDDMTAGNQQVPTLSGRLLYFW